MFISFDWNQTKGKKKKTWIHTMNIKQCPIIECKLILETMSY